MRTLRPAAEKLGAVREDPGLIDLKRDHTTCWRLSGARGTRRSPLWHWGSTSSCGGASVKAEASPATNTYDPRDIETRRSFHASLRASCMMQSRFVTLSTQSPTTPILRHQHKAALEHHDERPPPSIRRGMRAYAPPGIEGSPRGHSGARA
jgi:hypothetical protein